MILRLRMHEDELKAYAIYLIFIDIFLTGTNHGCQFGINVVAAHTLNISKNIKNLIDRSLVSFIPY